MDIPLNVCRDCNMQRTKETSFRCKCGLKLYSSKIQQSPKSTYICARCGTKRKGAKEVSLYCGCGLSQSLSSGLEIIQQIAKTSEQRRLDNVKSPKPPPILTSWRTLKTLRET